MSDLISRSKLLKEIETWGGCVEALHDYIQNMPTAYSVDKVVKKLEENSSRYTKKYNTPYGNNGYRDVKAISIHKAIEIVKQGGVSDDVCEWERDEHSDNDNPAEWIICPHNPKRIYSKDIKYRPYCGKKIKVVE